MAELFIYYRWCHVKTNMPHTFVRSET